jgi:hypothetical protein
MDDEVVPQETIKETTQTCAHCGAENPPGLLLCLECGRDPATGRDLFAPPPILVPDAPKESSLSVSHYDLAIRLPEPIQVPDPLPIPTMEDFAAPPPTPHPAPPPVYRAAPKPPRDMTPLLNPIPRRILVLFGLIGLAFVGLGMVGSFASLNLAGGICLGSVWLILVVGWLAIVLAKQGETYNRTTNVHRRLISTFGQRLFEVTPGAAKEQRIQQAVAEEIPPLTRAASELIYLTGTGDRNEQLTQLLLGTLSALVASGNLEIASQTYDVLTATPFKRNVETVKKTVLQPRALYVGAGYLEKLILERLNQSPAPNTRELASYVLHQAGADLIERISANIQELPPPEEGDEQAPDLDSQIAALQGFYQQLQALNPDLFEQLTQEVEEAVKTFARGADRRRP